MFAECLSYIESGGLAGALFAAGLIGGFSHCAGMCGPFVVAQTGDLQKMRSFLLLPYHLGRMTTYILLAVLTNSVINLAFAASPLKSMIAAPMLSLAGVMFLITAFPQAGAAFPWAGRLRLSLPSGWISAGAGRLGAGAPGVLRRYLLGVLLGFMPCGLVLSALLAAATADTTAQAALAMAAFSAGTVPALTLAAFGGKLLGSLFPRFSGYAFRGLMALNGLWLIAMAGLLIR